MSRRKTIPRRCATLVAGWSLRHPSWRSRALHGRAETQWRSRLFAGLSQRRRLPHSRVSIGGTWSWRVAGQERWRRRVGQRNGNEREEIRHGLRATTERRSGRADQAAGWRTLAKLWQRYVRADRSRRARRTWLAQRQYATSNRRRQHQNASGLLADCQNAMVAIAASWGGVMPVTRNGFCGRDRNPHGPRRRHLARRLGRVAG